MVTSLLNSQDFVSHHLYNSFSPTTILLNTSTVNTAIFVANCRVSLCHVSCFVPSCCLMGRGIAEKAHSYASKGPGPDVVESPVEIWLVEMPRVQQRHSDSSQRLWWFLGLCLQVNIKRIRTKPDFHPGGSFQVMQGKTTSLSHFGAKDGQSLGTTIHPKWWVVQNHQGRILLHKFIGYYQFQGSFFVGDVAIVM